MSTIDQTASQVNTGAVSTLPVETASTQESLASSPDTVSNSEATNAAVATTTSTQTSISSRAQKLQKLADEFFPGGPSTLRITPEFVQRLNEYDFISQDQLDQLPASIKSLDSDNQDSIAQLISNAESILDKLKAEPEFEGLFDSLKNGVEQMEQFQAGGSQSFTKSSKLLANDIAAQLESLDKFDLTDQETKTLDQMILALNLTDKLNSSKSSTSSNDLINNYL